MRKMYVVRLTDQERSELQSVAVHGPRDCSWLTSRQPIACTHHGRSQPGRLPTMC